jgi:tRNA(Arg) A34 adenosine deaminase TadA
MTHSLFDKKQLGLVSYHILSLVLSRVSSRKYQIPRPLEIAFLIESETVYFATHFTSLSPTPHSAVFKLIQGIYRRFPNEARRIVRNRVFSNGPLNAMNYGVVKVAAKRITCGVQPAPGKPPASLKWVDLSDDHLDPLRVLETSKLDPLNYWNRSTPPKHPRDFLDLCHRIAHSAPSIGIRHLDNRPIASLLVSLDDGDRGPEILSVGVNMGSQNKTLHAEIVMLQTYYRSTGEIIPQYSKIYTTLKPCRMCAGVIWQYSDTQKTTQVIYANDDPGPHAQNTILTGNSFDRLRFCEVSSLISHQLQQQEH